MVFLAVPAGNVWAMPFNPAVNYGAGTQPLSVAVDDFNGDGKPDLAVANYYGSNNVSILLGVGNGTFNAAVNYGAGTQPRSVAVDDFNGDGKPDLAVANYGSNDVSILLGVGNGTFNAAVDYGAGTQPRSVAVGDFNGDGAPDLAVANEGNNNVSILLNTPEPPTVTGVNPASGTQGQSLPVIITGTNFTGATAVSFGAGITTNSFTVNSVTQITANITIAGNAALGARNVSVTTPVGIGTLTGGFTVQAAGQGDVLINEFVSNPNPTESEWVELFNTTGADIDLTGWKISNGVAPPIPLSPVCSSILPAYGILVFEPAGDWLPNNPGIVEITIFDGFNSSIHSVTYGTGTPLQPPAQGTSAARFDPATWQTNQAPTKGWFNDAGQPGKAPLLSTIDTDLAGQGITSNIGELANPSATPTGDAGLYFEKTGLGKIILTTCLNVSDNATVNAL